MGDEMGCLWMPLSQGHVGNRSTFSAAVVGALQVSIFPRGMCIRELQQAFRYCKVCDGGAFNTWFTTIVI
jgi:hypothetical protein